MNSENIEAFFEKAKSHPELNQKISALDAAAPQVAAESLAQLSREAGHPFTAEEFLEYTQAKNSELADSDLSSVAGGYRYVRKDFPEEPL